ncbi:hypothetical protein IJJ27_01525 [bacterium]|nr:hypothetical protein [bacterium]MBQ6436224.1 hypothetical protein [bacterium]
MPKTTSILFSFLLSFTVLLPFNHQNLTHAFTSPFANLSVGDKLQLDGQDFIKTGDSNLLMLSSTLTCPHGKRIAGQWAKCFECPTGSTYDSTNVTCTCTDNSLVYDINKSVCTIPDIPADADTLNCDAPIGYMDTWTGCSSLATHATVCLADPRDYRTYRVRKLADGQCWMIDSLKFGGNYGETDGCAANSGSGNFSNGGSRDANMAQETFATGYYGHCRAITATDSEDGNDYNNYLYDWVATMQSTLAYYGSSITFAPHHQGICPTGWHIPTGKNNSGEFYYLYSKAYSFNGSVFLDSTKGNFALSGYANGDDGSLRNQGNSGRYWSSTASGSSYGLGVYYFNVNSNGTVSSSGFLNEHHGFGVRCVQD